VRGLFIYQKRKGFIPFVSLFIPLIPLIQSMHGEIATYKGAKKGDVTESRKRDATRANNYLEKKACIGLETMHLGGAVPFFDSPTASFSLFDRRDA
jgi:hypothetical protein